MKFNKVGLLVIIILSVVLIGWLFIFNKESDNINTDSNDNDNLNYRLEKIPRNSKDSVFVDNKYVDFTFNDNVFNIKDGETIILSMNIDAVSAELKNLVKNGNIYYGLIKLSHSCEFNYEEGKECNSPSYMAIKFNDNVLDWSTLLDTPKTLEWDYTFISDKEIIYNFWDNQIDAEYNCFFVSLTQDGNKQYDTKFGNGEMCMKIQPRDDGLNTVLVARSDIISLVTIDGSGKKIDQKNITKPLERPTQNIFRPYLFENLLFCAIESEANGEILYQYNVSNDEELNYDFNEYLDENEKIGHVMHMYKQDNKYIAFTKIDKYSSDNSKKSSFEYIVIENNKAISRTLIKEISIKEVISIASIKQINNNSYLIDEQENNGVPGISWKLTILK